MLRTVDDVVYQVQVDAALERRILMGIAPVSAIGPTCIFWLPPLSLHDRHATLDTSDSTRS
jgi:hypothetical protein